MIIRLHNPFAAFISHKTSAVPVKKAPLTYSERIKYDRIATGLSVIALVLAFVLYSLFINV